MLKYPGRSSSEKLLSYRDQEAVSGTWPELGLNRKADYKIGRETESTAFMPAKNADVIKQVPAVAVFLADQGE